MAFCSLWLAFGAGLASFSVGTGAGFATGALLAELPAAGEVVAGRAVLPLPEFCFCAGLGVWAFAGCFAGSFAAGFVFWAGCFGEAGFASVFAGCFAGSFAAAGYFFGSVSFILRFASGSCLFSLSFFSWALAFGEAGAVFVEGVSHECFS